VGRRGRMASYCRTIKDRAIARYAAYMWALRHHWNSGKYSASELKFRHTTEFLQKQSAMWTCALGGFRQPCRTPKTKV
jgi:hypothetical protein